MRQMWHTQIPLEQFKAVVDALARVISPIGSNTYTEVVLCVYNINIYYYAHVVIRTRDNRSNLPRGRLTERPRPYRVLHITSIIYTYFAFPRICSATCRRGDQYNNIISLVNTTYYIYLCIY